jgi:hypothetical protein
MSEKQNFFVNMAVSENLFSFAGGTERKCKDLTQRVHGKPGARREKLTFIVAAAVCVAAQAEEAAMT